MLRVKFGAVVLLQVLLLTFIVVRYEYTVARGIPILLKVVTFKQGNILSLRGEHFILSYEISNIRLDTIKNMAGSLSQDDTVYCQLVKEEKFWRVIAIDKTFHPTTPTEVWLKGKVVSFEGNQVQVAYGIEKIFIPEGTGDYLERELNVEKLFAEIRVTSGGVGVIKQLVVNGHSIDLSRYRK